MAKPWVVAHRGASGHAPENTMAAFRRAVELGAGFIETDLQLSKDGRLVAIHDNELGRTTTGSGPVSAFTLDELRSLDAGSWFGREFSGERIPMLEEIIAFARQSDVVFFLELKAGSAWGIELALVNALRASQEAARTVALSFDAAALRTIVRMDPTLMCGFLYDDARADAVSTAVHAGVRQLAPRGDCVTPELVAQAHQAGLQVVTWTVNQAEQMRALAAAGVNGIMTDFPERLVGVLKDLQPAKS